ncbi:hypothetical protein VKT23_018483 [Stygiomarasmius scandens]|uniref:Uncharacterized protein n=1 Tax=Marasmiellus scandens TaxID=2682957 RepID=A0ABR1IP03_9AGAR
MAKLKKLHQLTLTWDPQSQLRIKHISKQVCLLESCLNFTNVPVKKVALADIEMGSEVPAPNEVQKSYTESSDSELSADMDDMDTDASECIEQIGSKDQSHKKRKRTARKRSAASRSTSKKRSQIQSKVQKDSSDSDPDDPLEDNDCKKCKNSRRVRKSNPQQQQPFSYCICKDDEPTKFEPLYFNKSTHIEVNSLLSRTKDYISRSSFEDNVPSSSAWLWIISHEQYRALTPLELQHMLELRPIIITDTPNTQLDSKFDRDSLEAIGSLTEKRETYG